MTIYRPGWRVVYPGEGVRVVQPGGGAAAYYAIVYNGTSTSINAGSPASLDDLPLGAFTAEAWVRLDSAGGYRAVLSKSTYTTRKEGWRLDANTWQAGGIQYGTTSAYLYGTTASVASKAAVSYGAIGTVWHHLAFTFDATGDAKARLWIDGTLQVTAASALAGYYTDAALACYAGRMDYAGPLWFKGNIGWARISNVVRYTIAFTPAAYNAPPASDANTLLLWQLTEGAGVTANDTSVNNNDGTIANGTWLAL